MIKKVYDILPALKSGVSPRRMSQQSSVHPHNKLRGFLKRCYKVKGMDCASCATLIEMDLEDVGIIASCSYSKQTLKVEFDPQKNNENKIKEIVESSGYSIH